MTARSPRGAVFFWIILSTLLGFLLFSTMWWRYDPNANVDLVQQAGPSLVGDPSGHGRIISVQLQPVPEGPVSSLYARRGSTKHGLSRPLRAVARYIPQPLPEPLDQNGCGTGGDLIVRFADGFRLPYGPCRRPPSIDHLWSRIAYLDTNHECAPR